MTTQAAQTGRATPTKRGPIPVPAAGLIVVLVLGLIVRVIALGRSALWRWCARR
jgi:hypothetical protein